MVLLKLTVKKQQKQNNNMLRSPSEQTLRLLSCVGLNIAYPHGLSVAVETELSLLRSSCGTWKFESLCRICSVTRHKSMHFKFVSMPDQ